MSRQKKWGVVQFSCFSSLIRYLLFLLAYVSQNLPVGISLQTRDYLREYKPLRSVLFRSSSHDSYTVHSSRCTHSSLFSPYNAAFETRIRHA